MRKDQLLLLIFVLYCAQKYKCSVFCADLNKLGSFSSAKSQHPDAHTYYKVRSERGIKKSDFNNSPIDLTEKDRVTRGVSGSKNHLRLGDAHQIANYFISGGPLKGHAHFTTGECSSNNNDNSTVGMSNPKNENDTDSSINDQNSNMPDSIVGASHIPLLPHIPPLPPINPIVQPTNLYKPTPLHPPLNPLIPPPHVPVHHSLLGSILHPRFHPHISALHNFPGALIRAASMPVHGLLQAQSHLHDIMQPHGLVGNSELLGSTHKVSQSSTPYSHPSVHLQPTGYIVWYVPHNKESDPESPVPDAMEQKPSDSIDNNSQTEENVTVSTNEENRDTDTDKKVSAQYEDD